MIECGNFSVPRNPEEMSTETRTEQVTIKLYNIRVLRLDRNILLFHGAILLSNQRIGSNVVFEYLQQNIILGRQEDVS